MLKRTLTIIGNIILVALLVIGVFIVGSLLPIKNNYKILSVMSGSMEPAIKTGSVVIIFPRNSYSAGEIITFKQFKENKDVFTTHRLASIEEKDGNKIFKTKGDANEEGDFEPIEPGSVVGKVVLAVPYLGYAISSIKSLPGLLLIIVVPAVIIIYEQVKVIHGEAKEILNKKIEEKKILNKKSRSKKIIKKPRKTKKIDKKDNKKTKKESLKIKKVKKSVKKIAKTKRAKR